MLEVVRLRTVGDAGMMRHAITGLLACFVPALAQADALAAYLCGSGEEVLAFVVRDAGDGPEIRGSALPDRVAVTRLANGYALTVPDAPDQVMFLRRPAGEWVFTNVENGAVDIKRCVEATALVPLVQAVAPPTALADREAAERARVRAAALLAASRAQIAELTADRAEVDRKVALLSAQIQALRKQLGTLQNLLDAAEARDAEAQVRLETLGSSLNHALARVAMEERRRRELEVEREAARPETRAGTLSEVFEAEPEVPDADDDTVFEPGAAASGAEN